jgi:ABC-2 type transport system ATP-binding protein
MANMDPESQHAFKREVKRLGSATLISTHQLDAVEKFCDRVGIIKEGRLITEKNVKDVESLESLFMEVVK